LEEDENDDNEDDAFSDALETLSSTESLCVSGLDNLDANKCRTSSTDGKQSLRLHDEPVFTCSEGYDFATTSTCSKKTICSVTTT